MRKEGSERGGKCPTAHSEKTPELGLELLSASYGALGLPLPALLDIEDRRSPPSWGPCWGRRVIVSTVQSPALWGGLHSCTVPFTLPVQVFGLFAKDS